MLTIDFNKFDKKGMKKVLDLFDKAALPIANVEADNKGKREAGYPIKQATITFESGQVLILKIKSEGSLYQAKLNSKVLAIKNYIKPDSFMDEVIGYVKDNEPNYQKQKEKAALKQKVAVPTIKAVNSTVSEQSQQFQATLDGLKGQTETATGEIAALAPIVIEKKTMLDGLRTQIADENTVSLDLERQLENARKGIFESAGDGSERCPKCDMDLTDCECNTDPIVEAADGEVKCPECDAAMQECDGGMECPECGCKTDGDGIILEGCKKKEVAQP